MAGVRVVLNSRGIVDVLQSEEVQRDLRRRAEAIANAAGGAPDFEAAVEVVGDRAMGRVWTATTEGKRAEAEDRALTRALDAGR
jgi:hypothetical protein